MTPGKWRVENVALVALVLTEAVGVSGLAAGISTGHRQLTLVGGILCAIPILAWGALVCLLICLNVTDRF